MIDVTTLSLPANTNLIPLLLLLGIAAQQLPPQNSPCPYWLPLTPANLRYHCPATDIPDAAEHEASPAIGE